MITEVELGWAAAVLDCRGKISYKANKMRATRQQVILVESKVQQVIKRLADMTGTKPEVHRNQVIKIEWDRRGCIEHCPDAHIHEYRKEMPEVFKWSATGVSAAIVIYNLLPYLTLKEQWRPVMVNVLEQAALEGPGSGAIRAAARRLGTLGWRMPEQVFESMMAD
jgi:hypothetical protein